VKPLQPANGRRRLLWQRLLLLVFILFRHEELVFRGAIALLLALLLARALELRLALDGHSRPRLTALRR